MIRGDSMARGTRVLSETGIYHVMLRGNNKNEIFLKYADYEKFINIVENVQEKSLFNVYAYCLMNNHVHLLLKTNNEEIGDSMKRIAISYAQYHNRKYGKTGHLFQNRFKSEPINDDKYLLTVVRYIHQNPLKAKLVTSVEYYKWSSFSEYTNKKPLLIDRSFILDYFKDIDDFIRFNKEFSEDECLEYYESKNWNDDELKEHIYEYYDARMFQSPNPKIKYKIINDVKNKTGVSNRQLSRVLNISRAIIDKAVNS